MKAARVRDAENFDVVFDCGQKKDPATVRKRTSASLMRE
jgi:hypothetical protein